MLLFCFFIESSAQPALEHHPNTNRFEIDVDERFLSGMRGTNQLEDDHVIYMLRLTGQELTRRSNRVPYPKCIILSPHFLLSSNEMRYDEFIGMGGNLDRCKVIIPVFIDRYEHWILFQADLGAKKLSVFDSSAHTLKDKYTDEVDELLGFLDYFFARMNTKTPRLSVEYPVSPRQTNDYDCGVFVIVNAYILILNRQLSYSQNDIPLFRLQIEDMMVEGRFTDFYK